MFTLTDEQRSLQETAHRFAKEVIRPVSAKYDVADAFPRAELEQAWKTGLSCEVIPQEYGGLGLGVLDLCLVDEELAWGCAGFWVSLTVNNLALNALVLAGTDAQKKKFLPPFTETFRMVSYCQSEPGAGSDPGALRTTAVKKGDHYVLNGSKQWITNAGEADLFLVFANTEPKAGKHGITCFAVEKGTPGLVVGKKEDKMGQRASDTRQVVFDDCAVPAANRVGEEGQGFKLAMRLLDRSRPTIGAAATGIARAAMEHAARYAQERQQFGQAIAGFQGVQFLLADMAKDVSASRLLSWHAAWLVDQKLPSTEAASISKCFATDAAMRVTTDAVQVFGGYGYTKEYPVEKLMRDAKVLQIYEGTNQIQRVVIARELLKKVAS